MGKVCFRFDARNSPLHERAGEPGRTQIGHGKPRRAVDSSSLPAEVRERYGVAPRQVPDFIALRGDASDKIPGAKGVGERTAAGLLIKYGSLEKLLAAGRFAGQADELRLYRSIATMDKSAPLPALKDQVPTWSRASELARRWELNRLADRLAGLADARA